ncbi:hypothetical protein TraAM80_05447 [Trypanosoma rangeli]|uniref:Uncharacterized protein n=1 Tax=Trypanosoma rangeli TaxID=5698 RepID=A0A422NEN8_TRYRA|nr:uncharacterized protein TraAM80_05447 [Trypanosoma rangeli]RNF03921.1 hypothetical protein TraAM80_05447 [Trypanosoma rangeli]|eukprot:RNF03921.1 hypothetical protein TraAM80_05447 [Trypanosoma rangeli]
MPLTPNDDIVEISRRCNFLRMALANAEDAFKTNPTLKYMYLCEVSEERPNPTFLCFSKGTYGSRLDLHRDYLSQRAILPIILTLPLCPWLKHINLREERLTTTLIEILCESLKNLPRIRTIDVSGNPFGSFGLQALLKLVLWRRSIVDCYVGSTQGVGSLLRRLQMACGRNYRDLAQREQEETEKEEEEEEEEEEKMGFVMGVETEQEGEASDALLT